jgi:hypothetical protein
MVAFRWHTTTTPNKKKSTLQHKHKQKHNTCTSLCHTARQRHAHRYLTVCLSHYLRLQGDARVGVPTVSDRHLGGIAPQTMGHLCEGAHRGRGRQHNPRRVEVGSVAERVGVGHAHCQAQQHERQQSQSQ